jgi:hypothetical protein
VHKLSVCGSVAVSLFVYSVGIMIARDLLVQSALYAGAGQCQHRVLSRAETETGHIESLSAEAGTVADA